MNCAGGVALYLLISMSFCVSFEVIETVTKLHCCHDSSLHDRLICPGHYEPSLLSVPNLYISNIALTSASRRERLDLSFVAARSFQSLATFLGCNL